MAQTVLDNLDKFRLTYLVSNESGNGFFGKLEKMLQIAFALYRKHDTDFAPVPDDVFELQGHCKGFHDKQTSSVLLHRIGRQFARMGEILLFIVNR